MTKRSPKSSRQNLKRLVVLTLLSVFVVTSLMGNRSFAVQQSEADVIKQANTAIIEAQGAFNRARDKAFAAQARLSELKEFTNFPEPDINSITNLRRLTDTVGAMVNPGPPVKTLQTQLSEAQSDLSTALNKLTAAKTALDAATSTAAIEAAKTAVQTNIDGIKPKVDNPELNGLTAQLNQALGLVYPAVIKLADTADQRLTPFEQTVADPAQLFELFRTKFAQVPATIQFGLDLKQSWKDLSAQLQNVAPNHSTEGPKVDQALTTLNRSVVAVVAKLNSHLKVLSQGAHDQRVALEADMAIFKGKPAAHENQAIQSIQVGQTVVEELSKINEIVDAFSAVAKLPGITGFSESDTQKAQADLVTNIDDLRTAATTYHDQLAGDASLWVTEKIRLYYFTDIPRLVQTLNPLAKLRGGNAAARDAQQTRLDNLRAAEDAQSIANGAVVSLKQRVSRIRQQLQAANDELFAKRLIAQETSRRDAELNRRTSNVSQEDKKLSEERKNKAEEDRVAAQERADRLNDEKNGLAAQLREAEAQLEVAQAAFERASSATIRAAQAESAAFAEVRDNAPYWSGEASATNSDPARRVQIIASNGENAIWVRGRREDVNKVQDIVAKLDEPAPQARMTLWKIELNSDATEKGAEKFNEALHIVEDELAQTRARIADTLSTLLGAVSEEAERAAYSGAAHQFVRRDCHERVLYANTFPANTPSPAPLLLNRGISPADTDITGRNQRLKRYSLYSEEVQKELGLRFIDELGFDNPKQFGLKDPGSATTLNEALIILLLTDRDHRDAILRQFLTDARAKLGKKDPKKGIDYDFTRLYSMLGFNTTSIAAANTQTTRQQQELIYAIRGPLLRHLIGRIARLQDRVDEFRRLDERINRPLQTGWSLNTSAISADDVALHQCLKEKLPLIFDTIHDEFPISPVDVMDGHVKLIDSGEGTIGLQPMNGGRAYGPPKVYNLRPSPARVAAADGMLDVYTKAFEDDIDREFVQPMLVNLRKRLKKSGIGFGVIQRTSMLATNRLVARVDPRATAELSVGQETNLLQGLQSIAQITLASQTGNALGGLAQLKASASSEKDAAEIYGITSGSAFQVTPIFDPTGQALRFKFDFVDTTLVREPRGTTNPRLPRIERHTVNTEVQLANLEIREVSRFESDSKIGLPTTYWGGLPLVKDLPGVRPIPLIGWFVRRKGSNAIAQRSLIFAQTTMSPTIGDILNLFDTSLQRR